MRRMLKSTKKATEISELGINIIKQFEGLAKVKQGKVHAYPDPASGGEPWTIGYGTTVYPNGTKVKQGDIISFAQAEEYLISNVKKNYASKVAQLVTSNINQHQFDALSSLVYNIGGGAFSKSTLLKKVNINPNDPTIRDEFMKFVKASGKVFPGLVRRRTLEANLYFS